ncbi:MAG TPA: hypothetical protein VIO64_00410 [Pseudobacteroides sp.]
MDITVIVVIVLVVVFLVGGTIIGHYANKISEKDAESMNKNKKE